MKTIKVGLIQQANTAETKDNLLTLARNIEDVCKRGAQLVVLQELHNSLYFCQTEDTRNFVWQNPYRGLPPDSSANWPGSSASSSSHH